MKNASFNTLLDDLKISFKFAFKNVISYFLAIIGVLIVSGILLVLVAIVVFVPAMILSGGYLAFAAVMETFGLSLTSPGTSVVVGLVLILTPLIAPFFVAIGALFGMGREIVESEGTTASGVFAWYKRKFFPLAGAGLILFLFVVGPFLLAMLLGALVYGDSIFAVALFSTMTYNPVMSVIMALMMLWAVISTGLLSMIFPAVIDGVPVLQAAKQSVSMGIKYFDRIFGFWVAFLLLLAALIAPIVVSAFFFGPSALTFLAVIGGYAVLMSLFLVFVAIPAMSIGLTRIYMILTAEDQTAVPSDETDSISFVGGV
jgi:hypothetical protein